MAATDGLLVACKRWGSWRRRTSAVRQSCSGAFGPTPPCYMGFLTKPLQDHRQESETEKSTLKV